VTALRASYFIVANVAILLLMVEGLAHLAIRTYERMVPTLAYRRLSEPAKASSPRKQDSSRQP
jgi:hypothetical protein